MLYPDFGRCAIQSIQIAKQFRTQKLLPKVCFGLFTPDTAIHTWDERWQKVAAKIFTHFWIELDLFMDFSNRQFGYVEDTFTSPSDVRYTLLGYADIDTFKLTPTNKKYEIAWNSYSIKNGAPVMKVTYLGPPIR